MKDEELENILNILKNSFKMNDWDIQIIPDRTLMVSGETHIVYNDYVSTIKINPDLKLSEQRLTLIHEFVHMLLRDTQQILDDNIENEDVKSIISRLMERETEKIAKGINELL